MSPDKDIFYKRIYGKEHYSTLLIGCPLSYLRFSPYFKSHFILTFHKFNACLITCIFVKLRLISDFDDLIVISNKQLFQPSLQFFMPIGFHTLVINFGHTIVFFFLRSLTINFLDFIFHTKVCTVVIFLVSNS